MMSSLRGVTALSVLTACPSTQPRSCGPLLAPGTQLLGAEHRPPPNLLFVNVTSSALRRPRNGDLHRESERASERIALVCVPAKSGSTSFYNWLYRVLAGRPWPYRGSPWIHNTTSPRWHGAPVQCRGLCRAPPEAKKACVCILWVLHGACTLRVGRTLCKVCVRCVKYVYAV